MDELKAPWSDFLIRELLDGETPMLELPLPPVIADANPIASPSSIEVPVDKHYSGPNIGDFETSLSTIGYGDYVPRHVLESSLPSLERSLISQCESKYTLRIRNYGNTMADDGYKWRKYGQKTIKNSPHPRSYYRCINPRCGAKKQVERSTDDPETLIVTYEGLHLHFAYPFLSFDQELHANPPKKPKKANHEEQPTREPEENSRDTSLGPVVPASSVLLDSPEERTVSEGLLEDMVPWRVRNPLL